MWRRQPISGHVLLRLRLRSFSSSVSGQVPPSPTPSCEIPTLYSFLQPTIFPGKWPPPSSTSSRPPPPPSPPEPLSATAAHELSAHLQSSLSAHHTDEAWKCFKRLANASLFPSKQLSHSLIAHLSSLNDLHNLKRAFAASVFLLEKNPNSLSLESVEILFKAFNYANTPVPALALIKSMFKNRFFVPFAIWGEVLIELSRKNGNFTGFLRIFYENCRLALEEGLDSLRPDLAACNAALEGCCRDLGSVCEAEKVIETMSLLRVRPDATSFGLLAYLYAWKDLEEKVSELERVMNGFEFTSCSEVSPRKVFYSNLISGYVKSGKLQSVGDVIVRFLHERDNSDSILTEHNYAEVAEVFIRDGKLVDIAKLIIEAQKFENTENSDSSTGFESSFGFGIVNACVNLGLLDKAHAILDEMDALGGAIGIGVYASILRAFCKERRTTEAAQLVTTITSSGLKLDASSYDALIDASMSTQDFQSAFSLFRDMRETRLPDLKMSYLTIMTGLTENHRPELMAAFLDEVVDDPRIEIGTHDWNSIIHAFCKLGRLEDARRTLRRMVFLRYQPNGQTYLSLINGYVAAGTYFNVLMLWTEVKKNISVEGPRIKFDHSLVDAFLYAFVKGGFFDAAMQVVEKAQDMKIFIDKWRYKQAFMETHKKLKIQKLRRRNFRKMEALIAFKNWAGLNA